MADLGGVKEAIRTYEKIVERFRIQPLHHVEADNYVEAGNYVVAQ